MTTAFPSAPDVSIVVPIYNEVENLPDLVERIAHAMSAQPLGFELLAVDDGSRDGSADKLRELAATRPWLRPVFLARNYGQSSALQAGFDRVRGRYVVTLDADLQNEPQDIPLLLQRLETDPDVDMVSGWRHQRQDKALSRRLPSMLANRLISWVTGVGLHDYGCTLKAFRREVIDNINLYGEMHRFIPAIASGMGISFTEVKVNHRARRFGTSKYGISRTIRVVLDLITVKFMLSYATRPLHVFGTVGVVSSLLGVTIGLILTVQRQLFGIGLANRPLLLLAVLLIFMGIQFITIGLLAELVVRTYHESQKKPIYYVRKVLGEPAEAEG